MVKTKSFSVSRFFKVVCISLIVFCLLSTTVFAASDLSYDGYNYDAYGVSTPAPEGYEPTLQIRGEALPCGAFNAPEDIFYAKDENIYIADTGNNRIVVLDKAYNFVRQINTIVIDGKTEALEKPNGIYVANNNLYIVQSEKQRVLRCSLDGEVLSQFLRPVSDIFNDEMTYTPIKVLVNNSGTVYVLVKNFVYGALTYSPEGDFLNYYGSNKVAASIELLGDYFWKQILNKDQVSQMKRYVPTEYVNFCIDKDNFIYTVTKGVRSAQIKRLNTLGENVLPEYERNVSSHTGNYGDIETDVFKGVRTNNAFVDVAVDSDGFINILDQENGRIFQFDPESRLMHIFGGNANAGYGLAKATSLEVIGDDILVVDSGKNGLTVFSPTEYGVLVKNAVMLYNDGFYAEAATAWEEIITHNSNFELAYDGLGKAAFEAGEYQQAMKYYKLAYSRDGYSDAFKEYRAGLLRVSIPYIATALIVIVLAIAIIRLKLKPKFNVMNSTTMQVLFHPSDTLFEMKYHKRFEIRMIPIVVAFLVVSTICTRQLTAFTFNYNNPNKENVLVVLFVILYIFISFCTVNWCITSLLDGKGSLKEICCSVCYSLIPYITASFISVTLSHFLAIEEGMFLTVITAIGLLWSVMLFISTFKVIHEYSFSKTILSILFSLLGVVILIFLCVLLFGLLEQAIGFVGTIVNEVLYRV